MKSKGLKYALSILGTVVVILVVGYGVHFYSKMSANQKAIADMEKQIWVDPIKKPVNAPGFTLTDQHGKKVSLNQFKGKVVVLQFMDPVCTDICPIVSQELIQANHQLGSKVKNVVYVAVNVNQYHESLKDTTAFSKEQGLDQQPNWYFVTGTTDELKKVWKDYQIEVQPNPDGDVVHSATFYFIDTHGIERYTGNPDNAKSSIAAWGKGIAFFSKQLM